MSWRADEAEKARLWGWSVKSRLWDRGSLFWAWRDK